MLWSKAYLNGIANVYYESVWNRLHWDPLAFMFNLKTGNVFILPEYGNRAAIRVWTNTHNFIRPGASWVIIKTHAETHLAVNTVGILPHNLLHTWDRKRSAPP